MLPFPRGSVYVRVTRADRFISRPVIVPDMEFELPRILERPADVSQNDEPLLIFVEHTLTLDVDDAIEEPCLEKAPFALFLTPVRRS